MRIHFLLIALLFLLIIEKCFSQCQYNYYSYSHFIEQQRAYDSGKLLIKNKKHEAAIKVYQSLVKNVSLKLPSRIKIALCYVNLNKPNKAIKEIDNAFREGHPIEYVKNEAAFLPLMPVIEEHYKRIRPKYLRTVNFTVRDKLCKMREDDQGIRYVLHEPGNLMKKKRDSIFAIMKGIDSVNMSYFREIERKYGWPDAKLIGRNETINDDRHPVYADLFVIHSSEKDNIIYLQSALKEICKGEESWWSAIGIMKNLLFRFNQDGFNKLRYTYLTNEGLIDWERSYFQLKVLSEFMHDNPNDRISMFIARYANETLESPNEHIKALDEIRKFLISEKINPEQIFIENEIRTVEDDGMGKYRMAYKLY